VFKTKKKKTEIRDSRKTMSRLWVKSESLCGVCDGIEVLRQQFRLERKAKKKMTDIELRHQTRSRLGERIAPKKRKRIRRQIEKVFLWEQKLNRYTFTGIKRREAKPRKKKERINTARVREGPKAKGVLLLGGSLE